MAMEYLEGQTLHQAIRQSAPFDEERTLHVGRQLCRALREAHALGVIHRDLKPANVFLVHHGDEADHVKVLDFGLEAHRRPARRPDPQTGLYGLAQVWRRADPGRGRRRPYRRLRARDVLYEMLSGKCLRLKHERHILMVRREPPPPMRHWNEPRLSPISGPGDALHREGSEQRVGSMDRLLAQLKQAAGVSATGRCPRGSGERWGLGSSGPVPALARLRSSRRRQVGALATASQTPVPLERAAFDDPFAPPPRSRTALLAAAVGAVLVGGLAGLVAFRMTSAPSATASPAVAGASAATASPSVVEPSGASATEPRAPGLRVVRVESTPAGASVREDGVERCASTPCDVVLRGDDVDREHRYVLARAGYRQETRTVSAREAIVRVELSRAADVAEPAPHRAGAQRPRGGASTAGGAAPPAGREPAAPSGYKDMPY